MTARRAIELPIASVTLLEDRAHVVRRGSLSLAAADDRVQIERVAPVIADKTVAVTVIEGSVAVVDARVRRRALVRLRDGDRVAEEEQLGAERARLERENDELAVQRERLQAEHDLLSRQLAALDQVASLSLVDMADDAAWGDELGPDAAARLAELAADERALTAQLVAREHEIEELDRTIQRLTVRIAAVDRPDAEQRADLEIDLAGAAGGVCELRVDYVVPGACWRPWHTARLDGASVELTTDACVWQNTGEDWRQVELMLSTERASLGAEPPRLASDLLRATRKSEQLVVQTREQDIDTAGLGGGGQPGVRAAAELPGIDDGGEVIALRAPERASIPSDGRPYRVRLASFSAEAETQLVAFPELAPVVLLKSTQQNKGSEPLLAGPVDLVRSSGLVGRTSILFIAPGERFDLGWGPDADLRISREVDVLEEKSRMLSAWVERDTRIRVRLSNLGAAARKLVVTERVPVSEIEKVKIEVDASRTSNKQRPDEHGFLRWTVDLAPFGHHELELTYQLRKHEDVQGI
ncbi:MAG TPA: mucoidy inhibitor MuiA family protein [Kofleriaceae bacterium]|nr:mucoidy inhibitor MuiA family protein [Kofleriaceae bacterium]